MTSGVTPANETPPSLALRPLIRAELYIDAAGAECREGPDTLDACVCVCGVGGCVCVGTV